MFIKKYPFYLLIILLLIAGSFFYHEWPKNTSLIQPPVAPVAESKRVEVQSKKSLTPEEHVALPKKVSETPLPKTDAEWKELLTSEQYHVLREKGTEAPFSNPLDHETRPGTYVTADCNEPVFRSEQKYDSGTGWPSFWAPIKPDAVVTQEDDSLFSVRTEVLSKCGGHLGHVFDDLPETYRSGRAGGPQPTGLRYCMNGLALKFIPDPPKTSEK